MGGKGGSTWCGEWTALRAMESLRTRLDSKEVRAKMRPMHRCGPLILSWRSCDCKFSGDKYSVCRSPKIARSFMIIMFWSFSMSILQLCT